MAEAHLYSEDDQARRLAERAARERPRKRKMPVRAHVRCVRCHKLIPPEKRRDARYCSERCRTRQKWALHDELRKEIALTVRAAKAAARCPCGLALDQRVRPGPVPKLCRRCYFREAQARYRARKKAEAG